MPARCPSGNADMAGCSQSDDEKECSHLEIEFWEAPANRRYIKSPRERLYIVREDGLGPRPGMLQHLSAKVRRCGQ